MASNETRAGAQTAAVSLARSTSRWLASRLLPQDCVLCAAPSGAGLLCAPCTADLPRMPEACPRCAMPSPGARVCGACLREPPSFDATIASLPYLYPVDRLVQALKFHARLPLARLLGERLAEVTSHRMRVDLVVPMPLAAGRLRERGFNQSAEIAKACARARGAAYAAEGAHRVRETPPQSRLAYRDRQRNVKDAFIADAAVIGRHVAIVDDVMTTGASLEALAAALVRGGALSVECWVVARAFGPEPDLDGMR